MADGRPFSWDDRPTTCRSINNNKYNGSMFQRQLSYQRTSGNVVAIKVHDLVPRSREVLDERLLRVVTCIDFRKCPELGVGAETEIDSRAGPLEFVRRSIAALIHAFRYRRGIPRRVHVEQVDEEIIRQCLGLLGEDTVFGLSEIRTQDAHATQQNRHLGSRQCEQLRAIQQKLLSRQRLSASEIVAEPVRYGLHYCK